MLNLLRIIGLVLSLTGLINAGEIDLTVDLGYSKYQGVDENNGISHWLGIRYAAPPVGDLRFRSPQEPVTNTTLQIADTVPSLQLLSMSTSAELFKHGPVCHFTPSTSLNKSRSEDCLFLDVYAPTSNKAPSPVFVWFQGGGFNTLSNPNQNGSALIQAGNYDIVFVTFNYRVGPYGFLASKEVQVCRLEGRLNHMHF